LHVLEHWRTSALHKLETRNGKPAGRILVGTMEGVLSDVQLVKGGDGQAQTTVPGRSQQTANAAKLRHSTERFLFCHWAVTVQKYHIHMVFWDISFCHFLQFRYAK